MREGRVVGEDTSPWNGVGVVAYRGRPCWWSLRNGSWQAEGGSMPHNGGCTEMSTVCWYVSRAFHRDRRQSAGASVRTCPRSEHKDNMTRTSCKPGYLVYVHVQLYSAAKTPPRRGNGAHSSCYGRSIQPRGEEAMLEQYHAVTQEAMTLVESGVTQEGCTLDVELPKKDAL